MARRDYVVEGAILECTLGTAPGEMVVTSQRKVKIKRKLKATSEDKMLKPPFFGSCTCSSPNPPCSPVLKEWQKTSKRSTMGNKRFVMVDSKIQCGKGGLVTVKDTGQKLVGTGKEELELDEKYPELNGEIIFANGYLSSSIGGALNAVRDMNPDEPDPDLLRGHNMNEEDRLDEKDILLASELAEINAKTAAENKTEKENAAIKVTAPTVVTHSFPLNTMPGVPPMPGIPMVTPALKEYQIDIPTDFKMVPAFTGQERKNVFWSYWNQLGNYKKGSATYAKYFNAENNEHFLNGSHGLASNGAHRLDHGIAQGYHWAKYQWGIIPKQEVDETKEKVPFIESYSPAYKPITIVMHSQGNAPGVGFALGLMKYANELGWDKMALNLIFLGVHQPQNLWEDDYEEFIKVKTKHYQADSDFWDSLAAWERAAIMGGGVNGKIVVAGHQYFKNKKDQNILKYLNGISELFSSEYHKLRNKRGIYEHLNAITDFNALKERAVQFTFANDRADIVCRDGDIPKIDSACNPKIDSSLYSVEFFNNGLSEENLNEYLNNQGKEIFEMSEGGQVVIPSHSAVPRLQAEEDEDAENGIRIDDDWADYRSIALDWGEAMSAYKKAKKAYEKVAGRKFKLKDLFFTAPYLYDKANEKVKFAVMQSRYRKLIRQYGRIQIADLYAHFAPVSFIHNEKILKHSDFEDGLGDTIWERIKKVGEDKFYRVEYQDNAKKEAELSNEQKEQRRKDEKNYVQGTGLIHMMNTSIADTMYINNVINFYTKGEETAAEQLYKEPMRSDAEQQVVDDLLKQFGDTRAQRELEKQRYLEELFRANQVKPDKVQVVPKPFPKR